MAGSEFMRFLLERLSRDCRSGWISSVPRTTLDASTYCRKGTCCHGA